MKFINYEIKFPRVNDSPLVMTVLGVNMLEIFVVIDPIGGNT